MRKRLAVVLMSLLAASASVARDEVGSYSIADALNHEDAKVALAGNIKFFFGEQKPGKVIKNFGEFKTSKKTNAFNKSDLAACQRAFISAMKTLKSRAETEGGNAVINIRSNYKNNLTSSDKAFRCGAGAIMAGVALVGTVATVE